jgi:mono/diheme cytochrome c family protein
MDTGGTRIGRVAGMRPGTMAAMASALLLAMTLMPAAASPAAALAAAPAADAIERPLVDGATDPLRGRAIALGRDGNCLLCHGLADAGRPTGNLAPPLDGVAAQMEPSSTWAVWMIRSRSVALGLSWARSRARY